MIVNNTKNKYHLFYAKTFLFFNYYSKMLTSNSNHDLYSTPWKLLVQILFVLRVYDSYLSLWWIVAQLVGLSYRENQKHFWSSSQSVLRGCETPVMLFCIYYHLQRDSFCLNEIWYVIMHLTSFMTNDFNIRLPFNVQSMLKLKEYLFVLIM